MTTKQLPNSVYAPDGSLYITLTDGGGNLAPSGGTGTVTSVGLSLPVDFTISNSPVTSIGTLTAVWANENANVFLAGPSSGSAAPPTWRTLVNADIPSSLSGLAITTSTGSFTTLSSSGILSTTSTGSSTTPSLVVGNATTGLYSVSTIGLGFAVNGVAKGDYGISIGSAWSFMGNLNVQGVLSTTNPSGVSIAGGRVILSPIGVGVLQIGASDAASPVAQTLQVQSVVAGNANTAGSTWILQGSLSNGSGGGDIIIKTTQSSAASGSQNTANTALTLKGGTQQVQLGTTIKFFNYTVSTLPSASTAGIGAMAFVTDASTTLVLGLGGAVVGGGANKVPVYSDGTNWNYG